MLSKNFTILASALFCAVAACANAQTYPVRPVTFVVPYPPGGGYDIAARLVATRLTERLGQTFVVENRVGAGGTIAMAAVAKAPADGYTLVAGGSSDVMITPHIARVQKLTYDPIKDFAPVAILATYTVMLAAHPSVPANTLQELVAYAKANPGKLTYGSAGVGTTGHISGEMFKSLAGIDIVHVPFKGAAPAIVALLGGHVDMQFGDIYTQGANARQGKVKALAVTSKSRSKFLPGVPSFAEAGYPDFEIVGWYGMLAPAGTPQDIVRRLNQAVVAIVSDPGIQQDLANIGSEAAPLPAESVRELILRDSPRFEKAVKASGARAD